MTALLSPRVWIALALASVLAFTHFAANRSGAARVRGQWDAAIAEQLRDSIDAERENRRLETARQSKVIEATNARSTRTQTIQVAVAALRPESDGLRHDSAALAASVSGASPETCRAAATAFDAVLGEMERAGAGLAAEAAGHASDSLMYQSAWPE